MAAACMLVSDFSYSLINIIYTPGSCRRWHLPSWATLAELSDGRPAAKALKYIFLHSNASNQVLEILKHDKIWGGQFALASPPPQILGGTRPPRDLRPWIQAPPGSGSLYYNYKGSFSIVLLAMCDAEYCFTMVNIGAAGSESDGGVFSHCALAHMLERNSLHLPQMATLPMSDVSAPYVIVADAAFPLKTYLLKPYPQRKLDAKKEIFNYRLSRARRIIENTFGIMTNRWRIFRRPLIALPKNAVRITKAACVLHNFLQRADNNNGGTARHYCPSGYTDTYDNDGNVILGQWRNDASGGDLVSLSGTSGNRSSRDAARVRDILADYFVSPQGEVAWQYKHTTDALRI